MVANIIVRFAKGDANNASAGDVDEETKDFTWFKYLRKRSLGMENKKAKIARSTPESIMENGANGRLARDCALLNVTDGAESQASVGAT